MEKQITLKEAKKHLRDAWINKEEGYGDPDQMWVVSYKNGDVIATFETNERLPMRGIIGICFRGSDSEYEAGTII